MISPLKKFLLLWEMVIMKALYFPVLLASFLLSFSVFAEVSSSNTNHEVLASHYENIIKEAELKLAEHKQNLEDYELHSYYYGRQGQEFQSHEIANIEYYEEVIRENIKAADFHRKMATEQSDKIRSVNIEGISSSRAIQ